MDLISEIIEKWIKGILIDGITGNLSGLFDNVNAKVGGNRFGCRLYPAGVEQRHFQYASNVCPTTVMLPIAAA